MKVITHTDMVCVTRTPLIVSHILSFSIPSFSTNCYFICSFIWKGVGGYLHYPLITHLLRPGLLCVHYTYFYLQLQPIFSDGNIVAFFVLLMLVHKE